ncbi:carotenoid oxygenase family protein [soil metagenome]
MNSNASFYTKLGLVAGIALGLASGTYYFITKQTLPIEQNLPPEPVVEENGPLLEPIQPQVSEPELESPALEEPIQEKPVAQPQKKPRKAQTKLPPLPFTPKPQHPACTHELGFKSLKQEITDQKLTIQGTVPSWLKGLFLSIGPAIFEIGSTQATHWLDGLGMVYLFKIDGQSINYTNKIIESGYCKECIGKGKLRGSTPEQKKSTWAKLTSAVSSSPRPIYDNANINVACFNNELVALTETPYPICLDTKTAQTTGSFSFTDKLEAQFTSAHPLFDPTTQEWYGVGVQYAHNSNYVIYKMGKESAQRKVIATIPVGYPTYIHSFAMTPHYIIITETPFIVSPYDLLLSDTSFIENFNWKPKNGTNFIVIDKKTGKKEGVYKTEPFFTLHHVNAYEENGEIIIDLIAYKDPQITKAFAYQNLCNPRLQLPSSHLKRFALDLGNGQVHARQLSPHNIELPNINPNKLMHKHNYIYVTSSERGFAQHLFKLDLSSKRHEQWHERNAYTTEPVFVPRPGATEEDDGLVISLILDAADKKSFLLILDAKSFKEVARAYVPHAIPFTVHSKFFAK